jgi:hypothetical protein
MWIEEVMKVMPSPRRRIYLRAIAGRDHRKRTPLSPDRDSTAAHHSRLYHVALHHSIPPTTPSLGLPLFWQHELAPSLVIPQLYF